MADNTNNKGEMVKVDPTDTGMMMAMPMEMSTLIPQATVFSPLMNAGPQGKILMYRATNEECRSIKDFLNVEIRVVNFLLHTVVPTKPDSNGEVTPWVRAVLVCDDGTLIDCGSKGVIKGLMSYNNFIRPAPWDNAPLVCTPVVQELGDGRQWYSLRLAQGQLTVEERGKRGRPVSK